LLANIDTIEVTVGAVMNGNAGAHRRPPAGKSIKLQAQKQRHDVSDGVHRHGLGI